MIIILERVGLNSKSIYRRNIIIICFNNVYRYFSKLTTVIQFRQIVNNYQLSFVKRVLPSNLRVSKCTITVTVIHYVVYTNATKTTLNQLDLSKTNQTKI